LSHDEPCKLSITTYQTFTISRKKFLAHKPVLSLLLVGTTKEGKSQRFSSLLRVIWNLGSGRGVTVQVEGKS